MKRPASLMLPLMLPLILAGCQTVGPNFTAPPAPPASAAYAADGAGRAALAQGPQQRWWQAFGSSDLDALVDRALARNAGLEASRETLTRARERITALAGSQLPQVDANARAQQHLEFEGHGRAGSALLVAAVAESLLCALAAGAPPVSLAGLHVNRVGGFLRNQGFGHVSLRGKKKSGKASPHRFSV